MIVDDQVRDIVQEGYSYPTVVLDGQIVLKPKAQWTNAEKTKSNYNNKAINAMYNGVTQIESHRICAYPNAKVAWNLLQTVHKGTDTVKQIKLRNLTTTIEMIQIKEFKTFDEFNANLSKIVN